MKGKKSTFICLLLFFLWNIEISSGFIGDLQTYVTFALNFKDKAEKALANARGENTTEEFEANLWGDRTQSYLEGIVGRVDKMSAALNAMNQKMDKKLDVLGEMLSGMPDAINKQQLMNAFSRHSDRITLAYNTLQLYASGKEKISEERVKRFIDDNVASQQRAGLEGILGDIESILISPVNPENLVTVMERIEKKKYQKAVCGKSPPHLILYEFYLTIGGLELIAMSALSTGYGLRELLNPEKEADIEIKYLQKRMTERIIRYATKFSESMIRLYQKHRNCDPVQPQQDVTFVEMWGLRGLISLNQWKLTTSDPENCQRNCANYNNVYPSNKWCHAKPSAWTDVVGSRPADVKKCTTDRMCMGKLTDCWPSEKIEYCIKENSRRRYEWITDKHMEAKKVSRFNGFSYTPGTDYVDTYEKTRGKKTDCEDATLDWWDYSLKQAWPDDEKFCSFCYCICYDDQPDSIAVNAVSLKPARSNTAKNKIVMSARFMVFDDVLHIQVQEGTVLKDFYASAKKKDWVELSKMKDDIKQSRKNPDNAKLKIDVDFTVITDKHAFNLDDIPLPHGRLLTGVKLGVVEAKEGQFKKRLQIEIESMEYDYKTGKLKQGTEEWTKPEPVEHGYQLKFEKMSPIDSSNTTMIYAKPNRFVVMSESDLDTDASQTTVPLFDAQGIASVPHMPLAGLGLSHHSSADSAGYLELTGYTANYGKFLATTSEGFRGKEEEEDEAEDFEY